eukprot:6644-Heterococcus_DN1.PRE.3
MRAFSDTVLPQYFKHGNIQSFVRQLNMYDFHKTVADPTNGEFRHPLFRKGQRDMLHLIKRKVREHCRMTALLYEGASITSRTSVLTASYGTAAVILRTHHCSRQVH